MEFPRDTDAACTGLILAGGRGARLGGADKGLLVLEGRPLVDVAAAALRPQVAALLVSANRNLDEYSRLGFATVPDALPDFQGPLAGMLAGLRACETPWLLTAACDSPALPADLAARMHAAVTREERKAAYAVVGGEHSYICALLHRSLADDLEAWLAAGQRAVRGWLARHEACAVEFTMPSAPYLNINTPADLQAAAG